ncbi:hypothetical protein GCM10027064_17120 [Microbacterium petrolearium]
MAEVEPLLRRGASIELDGRRGVEELADAIEALGWRHPHPEVVRCHNAVEFRFNA